MSYTIKLPNQKLTRQVPISKKTGDLGLSPVKTQSAFYVPTWGMFGNNTEYSDYQSLIDLGSFEEGEHLYDTLWIGKNIAPEVKYINVTLRDYPAYSVSVFKSLAFEDGRTDDFLDTFFSWKKDSIGPGQHMIMITKSLKLPDEVGAMTDPTLLGTQIILGAVNEETGQPMETPDNYSWNVYLPGGFTTIPLGIYSNLLGYYNEAEGKDQQVHIYLDRYTEVPTILRPVQPSLDPQPDDPVIYDDEYANIYFHVPADIYDDFVATYDGQFKDIVKIVEKTVPAWVENNDLAEFKKDYFEPSYTYEYTTIPEFRPDTVDFALIDPTKSEVPNINTKIVVNYLESEAEEIDEYGATPEDDSGSGGGGGK